MTEMAISPLRATQRVLADFLADQCRRGRLGLDDPLLAGLSDLAT